MLSGEFLADAGPLGVWLLLGGGFFVSRAAEYRARPADTLDRLILRRGYTDGR